MSKYNSSSHSAKKIPLAAGLLVAAIVLALWWSQPRPPTAPSSPALTIAAGASLTDALTELARLYEQQTGVPVRAAFGSSSTLAKQIAAGMPADLFISASVPWMDDLADKNLIQTATRSDLLSNTLVLIAPKNQPSSTSDTSLPSALAHLQGRLAVGDPDHVPAGIYAKQALINLGLWDQLKDHLAPAADVRAALRFVETGESTLGIVYGSDAVASHSVRVVATFPENTHEPIVFPVTLTKSAAPHAQRLLDFLRSPQAAAVFTRYGFTPIPALAKSPAAGSASMSDWWTLSSAERSALSLSIQVALWCVLAISLPGLALGWVLARQRFPGKSLLEALTYAPLVVPPVVTGYLALLLLGRHSPLGRMLEHYLGLRLAFTTSGAVLAAAVMSLPLLVRSVRLAIELADQRLEQAAATLGASPWRVFLTITLPLALPGVFSGLVLCLARSLGEFGATVTLAGNLPGQTQTLSLAVYSLLQSPTGAPAALRLTLLCLALSLAALVTSEFLARHMHRKLGLTSAC
ncbi:MAG: molybdate ABC transporter permease subunit [Phycisphaeraceae bacterium]|nr:molybdate ABC transporter permease subunit [Phycisphaeraceae bacterium]